MENIENSIILDKIILVSQSPARLNILNTLGMRVETIVTHTDETIDFSLSPSENVQNIAECKIRSIESGKYKNSLIMSADTMIYLDGRYLGKPSDEDNAKEMLSFISGKEHFIYTGYAVCLNDKIIKGTEYTKVKFKAMTTDEISQYVKSREPFGKAGAYAIQGLGACFVERIEGDFFSVVGLPICKMFQHIKEYFGITVFDFCSSN